MVVQRRHIRALSVGVRHSGKCAMDTLNLSKYRRWYMSLKTVLITVGQNLPVERRRMLVLLVLWIMRKRQNLLYGIHTLPDKIPKKNLTFLSLTEAFCYDSLRFRKCDLDALCLALGFNEPVYYLDNKCKVTNEELLIVLLYRISYPRKLTEMQLTMGREYSQLSSIFNFGVRHIYERHGDKLTSSLTELFSGRLLMYRNAVRAKIAAVNEGDIPPMLGDVALFLDGTSVQVSRHTDVQGLNIQRNLFDGKAKVHDIKFLGASSPDGMIVDLYGPVAGRHNDK